MSQNIRYLREILQNGCPLLLPDLQCFRRPASHHPAHRVHFSVSPHCSLSEQLWDNCCTHSWKNCRSENLLDLPHLLPGSSLSGKRISESVSSSHHCSSLCCWYKYYSHLHKNSPLQIQLLSDLWSHPVFRCSQKRLPGRKYCSDTPEEKYPRTPFLHHLLPECTHQFPMHRWPADQTA